MSKQIKFFEDVVVGVSGSRSVRDYDLVHTALTNVFESIMVEDGVRVRVIVGDAEGVDAHVITFCETYGVPYEVYPAEWDVHGNGAGIVRNSDLVEDADVYVTVWDGESSGTEDVLRKTFKSVMKGELELYAYHTDGLLKMGE